MRRLGVPRSAREHYVSLSYTLCTRMSRPVINVEPERGVEPLAYSLRVNCSTTELLRRDPGF